MYHADYAECNKPRALEWTYTSSASNTHTTLSWCSAICDVYSGLFPQIAIPDPANTDRPLNEQQYMINTTSGLYLSPESILSAIDIADLTGLMCYNALIDTQRPYLSGVTQLPQLPILLLFSTHIDTNSDGSMLIFDHWLLAEVQSISTNGSSSKHKRSKQSTTDTAATANSDTQERATAAITDIIAKACDLRLRLQQLLDCTLTKANKAVGIKHIINSNSSSKRRVTRQEQQQQPQRVGNAVNDDDTAVPRVLRDVQAKYAATPNTNATTTDGNASDVSISSRSSMDEEDTKLYNMRTTLAHDMSEFMRLHIKCSIRKVIVYEVEARLRATATNKATTTAAAAITTTGNTASAKAIDSSNDTLLKLLQQAVTGSVRAGSVSSLQLQSYKHDVQIASYIRWHSLNDISDAETTKYMKAAAGVLDSSSSIHKAALYVCPICTREMHVDQTQLEMHRAVCKPHTSASDAVSTHNTNSSKRMGSKKMIGTPVI